LKRRFSKILGVGLTLALLASLLLTAAPVSADVSKPTVDLSGEEEISETGVAYTLAFRINTALVETDNPTITVKFPDDTDVTDVGADDITIEATSGIGSDSGTVKTVSVTIDPDDPIVEIELDDLDLIGTKIGAMAYLQVTIADVTNPSDTGTYTLEVKTSAETTYVTSESYTIGVPTVGGFVYVYNPSNILLATYGGKGALDAAAVHFAKADYTIKVGPGTYELAGTITITGEGLTLESSAGAATTTIEVGVAAIPAIHIQADDVIVDGFTLDGYPHDGIWIKQGADDVTIQNNIFIDGDWSGIVLEEESGGVVVTGATISDNVFEDCFTAITVLSGATDNTISGNTITGCTDTTTAITIGGGSTLPLATQGNTITGNTITNNAGSGIWLFEWSGGFLDGNVIKGNTISENEGKGIVIAGTATKVTGLEILNNYIADNEEDGIWIQALTDWDVSNVIKFNTISGNGDDGIDNDDEVAGSADVDATFNWWGTTVADDIVVSGDVTFEPFLTDTAEAAIVAGKAVGGASSLDAKTECGVKVSGVVEDADPDVVADVISAFKYVANPEEAIDDTIGFYDVYVALPTGFDVTDVEATLKFYNTAITSGSTVKWWTGDFWDDCSDQDARAGLIWVTVTEDTAPSLEELEGTPFVVLAGEAVAEGLSAPVIAAPETGASDVSLTPTFAWWAVPAADGYYFEFADNANFVMPLVKLDGDMGRLLVTAYAYVGELPYSTAYYWKVKAVSGTIEAGDLLESDWVSAVFITKEEPVEPLPPIVIEPTPPAPAPIITITQPDIIVPLPAIVETPITPAWIYVIIGVGAVLVIALLVLIVRTRRVA